MDKCCYCWNSTCLYSNGTYRYNSIQAAANGYKLQSRSGCQYKQCYYNCSLTISCRNSHSDQTICYGETPVMLTATKPTGGSGSFGYQWQFSTNAGVSWTNVATGGTSLIYTPPSLTATTAFKLLQTDTYCDPDQVVITNICNHNCSLRTYSRNSLLRPNNLLRRNTCYA